MADAGGRIMPDDDPDPPNPAPGEPEAPDESEIDGILAEATDLTQKLEQQIGSEEPPPGTVADLHAIEDAAEFPDVEAELRQVESMLREIGEDDENPISIDHSAPPEQTPQHAHYAATSTPDASPTAPDAASATDGRHLGESVESPVEKPAGEHSETQLTKPHAPGVTEIAKISDISEIADMSDTAQIPDIPDPEDASLAEQPQTENLRRFPAMVQQPRLALAAAGSSLSLLTGRAVDTLLLVLDAVDGTFAFISYDIRRIFGWIALALFVAACAVTASSIAS